MKKAELVFIPLPVIGHLVSTVGFAKRLIDRDDRFSITIILMKPIFPSSSFDIYTTSLSASKLGIKLIDLPRVDPPSPEFARVPETYITLLIESYKPHVKDALTKIASTQPLANPARLAGLVLDFFCTSMIDVGNELGLPSYVFLTSGAAFLGFMLCLPARHDIVGAEFSESDPELVIPGLVNSVPPRCLPSSVFTKEGYAAYVKLAKRFRDTKGVILNTLPELESSAFIRFRNDETLPIYTVGPLIDLKSEAQTQLRGSSESSNIFNWLDDQPPSSVVFLCFGSGGNFSALQLREIARGLELSGQRFLWSMRQPPAKGENMALPADCPNPEEILPEGFVERTKGLGMVCGWVPQVEVLGHEAVGGFVSHCGWNSIMESVWHGVPIVTWPMYAEQQLNAFLMVKELGMAVELRLDYRMSDDVDLVKADEIEIAVRRVMVSDSQLRQKVKEMGEKSRMALLDGGSSFQMIGGLIDDVLVQ